MSRLCLTYTPMPPNIDLESQEDIRPTIIVQVLLFVVLCLILVGLITMMIVCHDQKCIDYFSFIKGFHRP